MVASVALLGTRSGDFIGKTAGDAAVYLNTSEPFCVCCVGVQGGGKSHTLSVLLENCLLPLPGPLADPLVRLQKPMTAMVLHYDDNDTKVCQTTGLTAIHPSLSQSKLARALPKDKLTILVSPTNLKARRVFSSIFVHYLFGY